MCAYKGLGPYPWRVTSPIRFPGQGVCIATLSNINIQSYCSCRHSLT